jgi:DNA repair protein RadC
MLVSLAGALNKRSKKKKASSKMRFSNLESVGNFFAERFSGSTKEIVAAMYLDNKMHLIDVSTVAEGSIGEAAFAPSKIVRNAIIKDASAVILAHNHPGGVAVASLSDRNISIVLETSLAAVEIPLIEHLIITEVGYTPTLMFKPHTARTNITTRIFGEDFYRKFYK